MKIVMFSFAVILSSLSYSQTTREQVPINYPVVQLLGIEFEIKDVPQPDTQRLQLIPYAALCSHRLPESDQEIYDPVSNYTVILYSDSRCQQNKH